VVADIHPDDRPSVDQQTKAAIIHGHRVDGQWRVANSGPMPRWLLSRGQAVRDEPARSFATSGVNTDITEQKKVELALRPKCRTGGGLLTSRVESACSIAERGIIEMNPAVQSILEISSEV